MHRQALGLRGKAQRKQERKRLGRLSDIVISALARKRYEVAIAVFFAWLAMEGIRLASQVPAFDLQVCEFIDMCWEEGETRMVVGDLLSGLQHKVPALRGALRGGWRLWAAWGRRELPARVPPISLFALQALVGWCVWHRYGDVAIALLLGFDGLLRTAEMLSIQSLHWVESENAVSAMLLLPSTKSGARRGVIESVTYNDKDLVQLVSAFVSRLARGQHLLSRSAREFRIIFHEGVQALGLGSDLQPYSIRRGGATHFFRRFGSLDKTVERGRWSNVRTARIYITTALQEQHEQSFQPEQLKTLDFYRAVLAAA